jgi:uncharacterized caspase-like protein
MICGDFFLHAFSRDFFRMLFVLKIIMLRYFFDIFLPKAPWGPDQRLVPLFCLTCSLVCCIFQPCLMQACYKDYRMTWGKRLFLLWFIYLSVPHQGTAQIASAQGTTYAVVVGISKYKNENMPALQFSDRDAALFADHLKSKAGGSVPAENVKLLVNENATIAAIYEALNWLQESCREKDKAYFYFSGHGDVETKNTFSLGYLLAYNSPPTNYRNNAITIEDLSRMANHLSINSNATVVLVTDACHTGKLAGDYYKGKQLVASQLSRILNKEVRLAACAVDEEAAEGVDWGEGRGVFSYYLLKGLDGPADLNKNDTIQLEELNRYLELAFKSDKTLIRNGLKQHPVLDGNPYQTMSVVDRSAIKPANKTSISQENETQASSLLKIFKPLGAQPIDYLFGLIKTREIGSEFRFGAYGGVQKDSFPLKIVSDYVGFQHALFRERDSLRLVNQPFGKNRHLADLDTLTMLKNQLLGSIPLVNSFNERFIQMVHGEAQDMVNAYLAGDLDELEKRQYYYDGNRRYRDFVTMLRVALQIAPKQHYLYNLLAVQEAYLSGLAERLDMVTTENVTTLMANAFRYQQKAMELEPYAAYIHNETGNLFMRSQDYKKARYHFDKAIELSPAWAIPWGNKIRLSLAVENLEEGVRAVRMADSLQHDLSYNFVNAGLVMEKKGDLFTAESYFQKAIVNNPNHFLPYERLGNIYISTGDYERANQFLTEAFARKKNFNINMNSFRFGMEEVRTLSPPVLAKEPCNLFTGNKHKALIPYLKLAYGLGLMQSNADSALQVMKESSGLANDMPLWRHYSGKILFIQKKWQQAEPLLLQAVNAYKSDSAFFVFLRDNLERRYGADSCLLFRLAGFQYDVLEDHYLLGSIYERRGDTGKALQQYAIISAIENRRQRDQAVFKESEMLKGADAARFREMMVKKRFVWKNEDEVDQMGGYLKTAGIYEKSGEYVKAEKAYLDQIQLNIDAANIRKIKSSSGFLGSNYNFRTSINRLAEASALEFYRRMLRIFPRDAEWQEKAGSFLYTRLLTAFRKIPVEKYKVAYDIVKFNAFPFSPYGQESRNQRDIFFDLPGTGETLGIAMPIYDPLNAALVNLNLAVKLSGEIQPKPKLLEAIADLNGWMCNQKAAFEKYKELTDRPSTAIALRTKIIDYSYATHESSFAVNQLSVLYRLGQASREQKMQLANSYALKGLPDKSFELLKNVGQGNPVQKEEVILAYAKTNWLAMKYKQSLDYLYSLATAGSGILKKDSTNKLVAARCYSIARINALLKQQDKALIALSKALESGFNYGNVLETDDAWKLLRTSEQWKELTTKYAAVLNAGNRLADSSKDWDEVRGMMMSD